ncbi:arsenate reductase ArsC [Acidobacteria bacterium AH-259-D05]|nr:arsenate reductase ArsC [Acidobacteria bacterium AH-259-D05]
MAEAFARYYGGNSVRLESAGTNPAGVNPNAIRAMNEVGLDISHHTSDALSSTNLEEFDYVVTLCGDAKNSCPVLPPHIQTEHWPLPDPAKIRGKPSEVIKGFRMVRYQIEHRVKELLQKILGATAEN